MGNISIYKFVAKMALEYRLSLENICKLLKLEPTQENKNKVYEIIMELNKDNYELTEAYKYLFNFETINESAEVSSKSYSKAVWFLMQYNDAKKRGDTDRVDRVINLLNKTNKDLEQLMKKGLPNRLTEEEISIISKYRIKYGISRSEFSNISGINKDRIARHERKIQDPVLRKKVDRLLDYHASILIQNHRSR